MDSPVITLKAYFCGCALQGHIATALRGFQTGLILTWLAKRGYFFVFLPPLAQMRLRLPNIFEKDTTPISYSAGSVIFSEGQKRDRMYVVKAGEVDLLVRGQLAETVPEDGFFGELAMIDDSPPDRHRRGQNRLCTNPHQRETICVS